MHAAPIHPTVGVADPGRIFWGEIAPCEHLVQIYQDDAVFLDALEGFVFGGIRAGDGIVVIATQVHRIALEKRLRARGAGLTAAIDAERYIALDAQETLAKFMVGGWPDGQTFERLVSDLVRRAGAGGQRRVRAFGEMVAILWAEGNAGATILLENMWHRFCKEKAFCLFCAYPRTGFTQDAEASMRTIHSVHSAVVDHGQFAGAGVLSYPRPGGVAPRRSSLQRGR